MADLVLPNCLKTDDHRNDRIILQWVKSEQVLKWSRNYSEGL